MEVSDQLLNKWNELYFNSEDQIELQTSFFSACELTIEWVYRLVCTVTDSYTAHQLCIIS